MTALTVKLVPVLSASVRARAAARGLTPSAFVSLALETYLEVSTNPAGRMSDSEFKATTWRAPWAKGYALENQKFPELKK